MVYDGEVGRKKRLNHEARSVKNVWGKVFVFVLGVGVYFFGLMRYRTTTRVAPTQIVVVNRVVDGDTLDSDKGERIRLIGIDAPEKEYKEQKEECFAQESKERLKELVEDHEVRLEKDMSERDKYDRLLRYVYINDVNINELLVREGFARLATYPPDTKYYGKLKEVERVAREEKAGLWGACGN